MKAVVASKAKDEILPAAIPAAANSDALMIYCVLRPPQPPLNIEAPEEEEVLAPKPNERTPGVEPTAVNTDVFPAHRLVTVALAVAFTPNNDSSE